MQKEFQSQNWKQFTSFTDKNRFSLPPKMNLQVNELYDVLFSSRMGLERKIHSFSRHFVTRHYYIDQNLVVQTKNESCRRS